MNGFGFIRIMECQGLYIFILASSASAVRRLGGTPARRLGGTSARQHVGSAARRVGPGVRKQIF